MHCPSFASLQLFVESNPFSDQVSLTARRNLCSENYFVTIFLIIIICTTHLKPSLSLSGILLPNTRPALIREHQIILPIKMLKKSPAAGKENESFPSEQRHSVSKLRRETLHWVHDNPTPDCGFNDAPPSFLLQPQSLCVQVHFKGSRI